MNSNAKMARTAGLLYLALAITAFYGLMYAPSQVYVKGDAATTTANLLAHEWVFRSGIVSNLISQVLFVFLVLALYRLLKSVSKPQARLMVALVLVSVPIVFLSEAFNITALVIAKGEQLQSVNAAQKPDFVMLFLKMNGYGIRLSETFWGLWLVPFGILVYRSGFIPRWLGILLILGGATYVIKTSTSILFPESQLFIPPVYSLAEVAAILWLVIMGARENPAKPTNG
jgi:hypothetical protein